MLVATVNLDKEDYIEALRRLNSRIVYATDFIKNTGCSAKTRGPRQLLNTNISSKSNYILRNSLL